MGGVVEARRLLGEASGGMLILMIGPDYGRMQQAAAEVGIPVREAGQVRDVQPLKREAAISGRSLALIASTPEVEDPLECNFLGSFLASLAYNSDRVVYFGPGVPAVIHPRKGAGGVPDWAVEAAEKLLAECPGLSRHVALKALLEASRALDGIERGRERQMQAAAK